MENVKIIDINGGQWNIKDQEARDKIAILEESFSTQDLQDVTIDMVSNYTVTIKQATNHYKSGKIHFIYMHFMNLKGYRVGTDVTARIAITNLRPKKLTSFTLYDCVSTGVLRCYLDVDGTINMGESVGIKTGNNNCFGELIFAEE